MLYLKISRLFGHWETPSFCHVDGRLNLEDVQCGGKKARSSHCEWTAPRRHDDRERQEELWFVCMKLSEVKPRRMEIASATCEWLHATMQGRGHLCRCRCGL